MKYGCIGLINSKIGHRIISNGEMRQGLFRVSFVSFLFGIATDALQITGIRKPSKTFGKLQ
jgi:hypothetical protein